MRPFSVEPDATGMLDAGDGQRIYWDASGAGRPAGAVRARRPGRRREQLRPQRVRPGEVPGRGVRPARLRAEHAERRGPGGEPGAPDHRAPDRRHGEAARPLGVGKWLLYGGSWGTTLALAYAQRHPERVSGLVLVATFTSSPDEIDWLYRGVRRLLPAQWEAFRAGAPDPDGDLLAGYSRLLASPDREVRLRAARDWCAWEDAVIPHERDSGQFSAGTDDELLTLARLCAHYYGHHAWLEDDQLLRDIHLLHGIPAVLIHGRADLSAPLRKAWQLAQAWPDAELVVIDDAGHTGSPSMGTAVLEAIARFEEP